MLTPLFDRLIVPGQANNEELKALSDGGFRMVVHGHAIQAAGFADAAAAWAAFDTQADVPTAP